MSIYYKDGRVDTRHVVAVYNTRYNGVSVVLFDPNAKDEQNKYEWVPLLDYYSCLDPLDPIVQTEESRKFMSSINYVKCELIQSEVFAYARAVSFKEYESKKRFYENSVGLLVKHLGKYCDCTVEIFKGRKYPKGTQFKPKYYNSYHIPGTYNHADYVTISDGSIKTDPHNCKIVDWGCHLEETIWEETLKKVLNVCVYSEDRELWRILDLEREIW